LTGGTVGILTLKVLGQKEELGLIDFSKVHFWWSDERYVSSESIDRNAKQARDAFLSSSEVAEANIHEFPSTDSGLSLDEARDECERMLAEAFGGSSPKMDLTILGMGPDGHVASLFPGIEHESKTVIAVQNSPKPPPQRLSLSIGAINDSGKIIFVVSGLDKAGAVKEVHTNPDCELPAAKVSAKGKTLWLVDEAAGSSFWSC
jgi:6-phosphogluconolactonase